jgi:2-amino-4-hydroxy-6-hydroxymethyldihydropteridine diphosphokinase
VPHPRLHLRRFVLLPLVEIAPHQVHPKLRVSVAELLARCSDSAKVVRVSPPPPV